MLVLLVKTSSLGDVVHLLPALTEAAAARPELAFDWLVEPAFAEIPRWHGAVDQVIEAPVRSWRRAPLAALRDGGPARLRRTLKARNYDLVIDAQGLIKSAVLASLAGGTRIGMNARSAREAAAARFYHRRVEVPVGMHAVERLRRLLAAALDYSIDHSIDGVIGSAIDSSLGNAMKGAAMPDYGLRGAHPRGDEILLLHGTTWPDKHWPEAHWCALAASLAAQGHPIAVPWGNDEERRRAERIARAGRGELVPRGDLTTLLGRLAKARGLVGVDSGLLHLAAAAGTPGIALYGPTDPVRTGPWGGSIRVLSGGMSCMPCLARTCASAAPVQLATDGVSALEPPCMGRIEPVRVQQALASVLLAFEQSASRRPGSEALGTKAPGAQAPESQTARFAASEARTTEVRALEVKAPEVKAPEASAPEARASELRPLGAEAPEVEAAESPAPEATASASSAQISERVDPHLRSN